MNKEELCDKLNKLNLQYPAGIPKDIIAEAADSNLVVVYGASDDLEGDSKELLDCPFCGVEPEIKESFGWKITCPVCKMGTPSEYGAAMVAVVKQWNSRKP